MNINVDIFTQSVKVEIDSGVVASGPVGPEGPAGPPAGVNFGLWNADANTPTIVDGVGNEGDFYTVEVAGATLINGAGPWVVNDQILFSGGSWTRVEGQATRKGFDLIPNPMSFEGPFQFKSLGLTVPPPGVYTGSGGNSLSFPTLISTPSGGADDDNQRASMLIVAETTDDGNSEEQTLCVLTTIKTGYSAEFQASTVYAAGDNFLVSSVNAVYRVVTGGTSGLTPPATRTTGIVNGSMVVDWINDAAINAKLAVYEETVCEPGGGSAWCHVNNFDLKPGYAAQFACATETDLTNNTGFDSVFGAYNKIGHWIACQGANTSTAGLQISSANTSNWAVLWGLYFAGAKLASNCVIGIDASSAIGIGFGAGSGGAATPNFTIATIRDNSISPDFLVIDGEHSGSGVTVLCDTNASFADSGEKTLTSFFSGATAPSAMRADGSYINAIRISGTCSNAQILGTGFAVDPMGRTYATGFQTGINPPASSTAPGVLGQIEFDDNYGYFCVAPNSWKRWALSAF